jgi:biotin carboxyl carrier protein
MAADSTDVLASYLDVRVADALREWADGLGGTVQLPSRRWHRKGYTGAELAAILLKAPRQPHKKMIVKVCPAGQLARETGKHNLALVEAQAFAKQHLVRQLYSRYPVRDGRFLMFQEIADGSLLASRPLSDLPADQLVAACGRVARALLNGWNGPDPEHRQIRVPAYLRAELADTLETGRSAWRWAGAIGLLDSDSDWITTPEDGVDHPLPNPYRLASKESLAKNVTIDYVFGRSHGDLHMDNVLVFWQPPQPPLPEKFHLIDLAAYSPEAPLTRDSVALMLSIVSRDVPALPDDQQDALLDFVITPAKQIPSTFKGAIGAAVWAIYEPGLRFAGSLLDEWRAQYLLSLLAAALLYTSFESVGPRGRWWFFRLAARASDEFLRFQLQGDAPTPAMLRRTRGPSVDPADKPSVRMAPEEAGRDLPDVLVESHEQARGHRAIDAEIAAVARSEPRQIPRSQTPVTFPEIGASITEGTITRWLKREGDRVEVDEPLFEISTDKVDTEVPAPASGVLTSIEVREDEIVAIGTRLAWITAVE